MCWGTFFLKGERRVIWQILSRILHMLNHLEKEYISDKEYMKFLTYYNQVENIRRKAQRYYKKIYKNMKMLYFIKKITGEL